MGQQQDVFAYIDALSEIDRASSLVNKLEAIHDVLKGRFPFIHRVAGAVRCRSRAADDLYFDLERMDYVEVLRNIAQFHHEAVDGSGYPNGYRGEQIPIEARIVAVADVFDALTSRRPYKQAWSNERAFEMLRSLSGTDCVNALIEERQEIEEIQRRFQENPFG